MFRQIFLKNDVISDIRFRSRGLYFLNTNAKSPFARGKNFNDEDTENESS
jgi:hypothetical protein